MLTDEFIPITADAILDILRERYGHEQDNEIDRERRQRPRWPFPGTVELWVPQDDGIELYMHARALNLSPMGIGILADEELPTGKRVALAIHQPEATLFGEAIIRHATQTPNGQVVGLQFLY
jgi:hypothetical protein